MYNQLLPRELTVLIKPIRPIGMYILGGHFVLNLICLAAAAIEYYVFFNVFLALSDSNSTFVNLDGQKSCRRAYLVVIATLTMTSAVAVTCGGIAYVSGLATHPRAGPKQLKKIGLAIAAVYLASGVLLFILFASLLARFCQEDTSFRVGNVLMMVVMFSAYVDASVYIALAVGAWMLTSPIIESRGE